MTRVKFTHTPALLHRPIIYELGKQFGVVTNIRRVGQVGSPTSSHRPRIEPGNDPGNPGNTVSAVSADCNQLFTCCNRAKWKPIRKFRQAAGQGCGRCQYSAYEG